jgi:hypothetical protein
VPTAAGYGPSDTMLSILSSLERFQSKVSVRSARGMQVLQVAPAAQIIIVVELRTQRKKGQRFTNEARYQYLLHPVARLPYSLYLGNCQT